MKKKWIIVIIIIVVVIGGALIFLSQNGYDTNTIINMRKTSDLSVDCSTITKAFGKQLTVSVSNRGDKTQNAIQVKIIAFDDNGNSVDEKTTTFERSLPPNSSFAKLVSVPKSTTRCDCVIQNSNPQ